jgi:transcriptional regulator with XRE-family HTH domain
MVVRIGQKSARPRRTFFREWRDYRGLTQEQLAERLGTTKGAVSKIENGTSRYNQSSLEAWAEALSCEPADLISRPPPSRDAQSRPSIEDLLKDASPALKNAVITILKTGT